MAYNIENYLNELMYDGATITTAKPWSFGSTMSITGALTLTAAATVGTTLGVTGATTLTGGIAGVAPFAITTVPIGSVAYSSFGTDTTMVAGSVYYIRLEVPTNFTATNINVLQGTISGTDKWIGAIYNSAGTKVGNSAIAGVTVTTSNTFLVLPLTATASLVGPGVYYLSVSSNGTTDKFRSVAASTFVSRTTGSATGSFGTLVAITAPTTFTANVGPIAYVN